MIKKQITLSLMLPCYLLADVHLDEISIEGEAQAKTKAIEIDLQTYEQRQANSLFDLFKNESSIDLAGGGSSNAKRIYLRGSESSTLNISLDGATQGTNTFQHRGNELGINPDLLKTLDVQTAPDASTGGALGGSIKMSTKDAQDFTKGAKNIGAIFKAGYSTNTESNIGSLIAYGVYDKHYGVVASLSGVNSENYEDGNGAEMLATAYEDRNYLLKFTLDNLNNHDLKVSINQNSNSGEMQWGRTGSDKGLNVNPELLEEVASTTTSYTLQHNYTAGNLLNLDTNVYFTNIFIDREDAGNEYDNDKVGVKIQNHFYVDIANTKNKFSLGFDILDEESTSNQKITQKPSNDPSHYAPVSAFTQALFIQNKTTIDDFSIGYGLRVDDYELETGLGKAEDTTYSPNFGLEYQIGESSNVYANYGQSSRMSGTTPFTWMMNIVDGSRYSKELEAEKSTRYEVGYNYMQDALLTSDDGFKFGASIFKTEFEDIILAYSGQNKSNGSMSYAGEGGAPLSDIYNKDYEYYSKGFEIRGSYYIDDYFASLSYTQVDTNVYNEKTAIPKEAGEPLAIRRVGGWDNKKLIFNAGAKLFDSLTLDYSLTAVAGIDEPDQITRAGYVRHDLSGMYKSNEASAWTFYIAVSNLTDKYYAPHTTLVGADADDYRRDMGRDFKLSIKYEL